MRGSVVADFTIPISGFSAVDNGPVNMKLGIAAGEGDVAAKGMQLFISREYQIGSNEILVFLKLIKRTKLQELILSFY